MFKTLLSILTLCVLAACMSFGDDSGEFANDGECDDPRFIGGGMASGLSNEGIGRDASDCSNLQKAGRIRWERQQSQWDVAQCAAIDYGNDSAQYANDGECDDPRFTGPGVDNITLASDLGIDASDCRALCERGAVWLK